ncbi:hypothetical protein BpHYR1_048538 [Brachionus plicatilis]|uniref:C2H2-type domain-containing protein n=1 Tax=Brachionus plicatilis TaxID=10195 RepID=A0A3M7QK22_BRAPC|nr:hypothetical protein BpHYR1_048538 [Brachionus plicatilis]
MSEKPNIICPKCFKKYITPKWFEKHLKVCANNLGNDKEIFSGDLLKQAFHFSDDFFNNLNILHLNINSLFLKKDEINDIVLLQTTIIGDLNMDHKSGCPFSDHKFVLGSFPISVERSNISTSHFSLTV